MTSLTDTQVVTASGGLVELGYGQVTSNTTINNATPGTGTEVIAPITVVCDGSPILVEFFSPEVRASTTANDEIKISLFEDSSEKIRSWGRNYNGAGGFNNKPHYLSVRLTPSAGSHTYGVKAYVSNAARTGSVGGGTGTSTTSAPCFLRVSKIVQASQWPAITTSTIICTSSTRPSSPFEGQMIYETDTDLVLVYDGSSWTPVSGSAPTWTSYTPTLTLTGLTPTYAERVGEYIVQDDWCTARFTMRISAVSGTHGVPYDWVVNLPVTPEISSGYTQNVGSMSNLHVYPAGYGVATCDATASSQNILFYLDSTSTVKLRNATHNTNKWSPSPTSGTPGAMVSGTLQYKVA